MNYDGAFCGCKFSSLSTRVLGFSRDAAIFATVEPLVGTLIGIFVWKESAGFLKMLGIAMIFAAIILASLPENSALHKKFKDSDSRFRLE